MEGLGSSLARGLKHSWQAEVAARMVLLLGVSTVIAISRVMQVLTSIDRALLGGLGSIAGSDEAHLQTTKSE